MVKFKKQVDKQKISHFLKATPLILFFHCFDKNDFCKVLKNHEAYSKIIENSSFLKWKDTLSDLTKIQESNTQTLIIKSVKNNYAKKVLLALNTFIKPKPTFQENQCIENPCFVEASRENTTSLEKNSFTKNLLENNCNLVQQHNNSKTKKSKTGINVSSLFQGKNILISLHDIKNLALLKNFIQDKNVNLLAGIYQDNIIDNNQIKHLAQICQDKEIYITLLNLLNNSTNQILYNFSKDLNFSYLLFSSNNLICLSKTPGFARV